jgi:very-short-patch-repair endonuclease/predicted transcriptional regulator
MTNKKLTTKEFIERVELAHGDKYDYSLIEYKNSFTKVKVICYEHGVFYKEAKSLSKGVGCSKCYNKTRGDSQRLTLKNFVERSKIIHVDKYDYSLVDYKNSKTKVDIICLEHGKFSKAPMKHLSGQGCGECSKNKFGLNKRITTEGFIIKAKLVHGDKYDYSLVNIINSIIKIKIICPEHGIWKQKPNGHLSGKGCRTCSGYKKLTTEDFVKKSNDIHECKYDYSLVDYKNHYGKVSIICPEHGIYNQGSGSHLAGVGCPNCNESKGEKKINSWLLDREIVFKRQKAFKNCKYKRQMYFDFYLPEYNLCIEFDGKQHFEAIEFFGGETGLIENKKRDNIKNKFCNKHNINILRISYKDDVIKKLETWDLQRIKY